MPIWTIDVRMWLKGLFPCSAYDAIWHNNRSRDSVFIINFIIIIIIIIILFFFIIIFFYYYYYFSFCPVLLYAGFQVPSIENVGIK